MSRRKKRAPGEGSLSKWGDKWRAQLVVGSTADGRPIRRSVTGASQKEAREKLDALKKELAEGRLVVTDMDKLTIGAFLDKWLHDIIAVKNDTRTHKLLSDLVKNHIRPHLGQVVLKRLTAMQVDEWMAALMHGGAGARTRQLALIALKQACKQAVKWKLLTANPCEGVERPKVEAKEFTVLTPDQVAIFLRAARRNRLYALFYLAIVTGMRRGELVGLKWADINFDPANPYLTVRRAVAYQPGHKVKVKEAKTRRSHRKIDLPEEALTVLKAHQAQSLREGNAGSPWVFISKKGTILHVNTIYYVFKSILKRAELPQMRLHELRHTHATLLLLADEKVKVVQERLGHTTLAMTSDLYSHVMPSMQRGAADKIGQLVKHPA